MAEKATAAVRRMLLMEDIMYWFVCEKMRDYSRKDARSEDGTDKYKGDKEKRKIRIRKRALKLFERL
jgi:hypothetical protein